MWIRQTPKLDHKQLGLEELDPTVQHLTLQVYPQWPMGMIIWTCKQK